MLTVLHDFRVGILAQALDGRPFEVATLDPRLEIDILQSGSIPLPKETSLAKVYEVHAPTA
jgi:hypothetical protein